MQCVEVSCHTAVLGGAAFHFSDFFFSSRRRHTRWTGDWSSDVCSSDLLRPGEAVHQAREAAATAQVDVDAALAWRDFMVSDYSDAGQDQIGRASCRERG